MLSGVLVLGENAVCRVVEKRSLIGKRHENTIALPLAQGGCKIVWQSGMEKKADMLLVQVLKWYHGRLD